MTLFRNKYRVESTRLKHWDYSSDGYYFITICTKDREKCFGEIKNGIMGLNELGCLAVRCWQEITEHFSKIELDAWVVMPNHMHGIIVIINHPSVETIHESSLQERNNSKYRRKMLIPKIIGRFKMMSAKQINILNNSVGKPFWQFNYYDRIIRDEKELNRVREYIQNNPLRWEYDRNKTENIWY